MPQPGDDDAYTGGSEAEEDELNYDEDYDDGEFKIRDQVSPPTAYSKTLAELHQDIHQSTIDLNPPYQREVVWPAAKQMMLIDSIWRNMYIPPLLFLKTVDEDGEEIKICMDGKQRLTSIQRFLDGVIAHKDKHTGKLYWYTQSDANKSVRLNVPDRYKMEFAEKQITCVEYQDLSPSNEREIFQRVQLGMSLTSAEKLQAVESPRAIWISKLDESHVQSLKSVLNWNTKRGRDFQCLSHMVYCCDGLPARSHPTGPKLEKYMAQMDSPTVQFQTNIMAALKDMWSIASNKKLNMGFTQVAKVVAPAEFVFIGVLLFLTPKATIQDRAKSIFTLRMKIRDEFKDVRANDSVAKAFWDIIYEIVDDPTKIDAAPQKRGRKKKRTAGDVEDGDGGEYRAPGGGKASGSGLKTRSKRV